MRAEGEQEPCAERKDDREKLFGQSGRTLQLDRAIRAARPRDLVSSGAHLIRRPAELAMPANAVPYDGFVGERAELGHNGC